MTGFAHGAAGVGYSLLELYQMTDNKKYQEAAELAYSYENHWFSEEANNWPDFRTPQEYRNQEEVEEENNLRYATAWCHGAPGIGLTRLRAYQLLRKEEYFRDSKAAIKTASRLAEQKEGTYNETNFSLCHGLTGICELLIYAATVLNQPSYELEAINIGLQGIRKYLAPNMQWPCGIPEGEPPDLMLGLAGIGYYYMRLYDPDMIPSVLMITPTYDRCG